MLKGLPLITFFTGIMAATYEAHAQQGLTVAPTSCTPDNFTEGSCTLTCTATNDNTLNSSNWQYYTTNEVRNIIIYDGVQLTRNNYTYTLSLTLDDYNAGTYVCLFYFANIPTQSATMRISKTDNGAELNDACTEDHDCYAMHATCSDYYYHQYVCQCIGQYNITYINAADTPACLKLEPEGGHCYSQVECDWPTQSYSCIDSQCHCTGNVTEVEFDGTEQKMCIEPVYLFDYCFYNEQCELTAEHSYCYDSGYGFGYGYCDCQDRYKQSNEYSPSNYCYYAGMSGWAITGIAFGTLFGLSILGSAIFYFLKKSN